MLRIAPKTRKKASLLPDGKHKVQILSIMDIDDKLAIKFNNNAGYIHSYLPLNEATVELLGKLGYMAGIPEGGSVEIGALIGLKCSIEVEYNNVKSISK